MCVAQALALVVDAAYMFMLYLQKAKNDICEANFSIFSIGFFRAHFLYFQMTKNTL